MNSIPLATGDRFLTMVSTENNNKFYHMHAPVDGKFMVEYGRIGGNSFGRKVASCVYDECQWDQVYANRINHGYTDISEEYFAMQVKDDAPAEEPVKEKETFTVRIMSRLKAFVSRFIETNYTIKAENITSAMVEKADELIIRLSNCKSVSAFNEVLCKIWRVIPRAMHDTRMLIARNEEDFKNIVKRESDYIDTIRALVCDTVKVERKADNSVTSYCDKHGLEIREVTKNEENEILKMMASESRGRYVRAYSVTNKPQEERFNAYAAQKGNVKRLFHGTVNENLYSIIGNGLLLNPNARITGKMFGNGSYFANRAKKSINYTSIDGSYWANGRSNTAYLMVFDVALGKQYDTYDHDLAWEKPGFHQKYDSVYAHAGRCLYNDEVIVYSESASCIRYLIEIR